MSASRATRLAGSCARRVSRTASEIWSHTLSGCPSATDSDVNRKSLLSMAGSPPALARAARWAHIYPNLPPGSRALLLVKVPLHQLSHGRQQLAGVAPLGLDLDEASLRGAERDQLQDALAVHPLPLETDPHRSREAPGRLHPQHRRPRVEAETVCQRQGGALGRLRSGHGFAVQRSMSRWRTETRCWRWTRRALSSSATTTERCFPPVQPTA